MSIVGKINPLFNAALEFQEFFERQRWGFCFIGGLAVLRWGELRMTQDVDLCLHCGFGMEKTYIEPLLNSFSARITDAHEFAMQNRVLLLYASNGVSMDITLSGLPFEEMMIKRATYYEFDTALSLFTCSAEDLIVLKAFADRSKDWMDIESILLRQSYLDQDYIFTKLEPLVAAKESIEIIPRLQTLISKS